MAYDHDQTSAPNPTMHNGHRTHVMEAAAFRAEPTHDRLTNGQHYPGHPNDDPSRMADDALMRCYNG
jgi:hypothetical protein